MLIKSKISEQMKNSNELLVNKVKEGDQEWSE
jgi:hypothetical protein